MPPTPSNPRLLSILSDQPADQDQLNLAPYAKTLADIIADPGTDTPLTIGVFGGWGQGKTSLMRMVQRRLEATAGTAFLVRAAWFNAWLYSHQPALWRALISRVLDVVRGFPTLGDADRATLRQLEARFYGATTPLSSQMTLQAGTLPGLGAITLPPLMGLELLRRQAQRQGDESATAQLEVLIADMEESEALTRRDQIAALDDFRRQFGAISRYCIVDHGRLAVFVDDLDRCQPDQVVEVLETIKLFLDMPGCTFILGVAREVIEEGIRVRYADYQTKLDGAQYLEKIIQIPFSLPPIAPTSAGVYMQYIGAGLPDNRCETVFAAGLEPNPRRIKRTLNIFLLLWRLAQNRADLRQIIKPVRLAKIVIIQQYHPRLFRLITDGPHYLIDLEKRFREQERRDLNAQEEIREREPAGEEMSVGPLSDFLGRSLLRNLLICTTPDEPDANFVDMSPASVREYIYLAQGTVGDTPITILGDGTVPFEPQMATIPVGTFMMGTSQGRSDLKKLDLECIEWEMPLHEVLLEAYAISRYPVTNAEFTRFTEDGGYGNPDYWTEAGWSRKESDGWTQPRCWEDEEWNDPSQPVVGVSWYETVAYCNWLAAKTGKPYRLPTEAEWEKAARGTDGRRYPWGNTWDASLCNNKESGPGRTTPVGQYSPNGDSPYGVSDITGQVWEWCSSKYNDMETQSRFSYPYRPDDGREEMDGADLRAQRGGSWADDNPAVVCRCAHRSGSLPTSRHDHVGFRCVRTLPGEALFWGEIEQSRKTNLEDHIRESFILIGEYEAAAQTSDHPEERARASRLVQEQWKLIEGYLAEYETLAGDTFPADISEIAGRLSDDIEQIHQKIYPLDTPSVPPGSAEAEVSADFEGFLRRQLAEAQANLELVLERKSQYVLEVDVPLQLVKEERRLRARIAKLKEDLRFSSQSY